MLEPCRRNADVAMALVGRASISGVSFIRWSLRMQVMRLVVLTPNTSALSVMASVAKAAAQAAIPHTRQALTPFRCSQHLRRSWRRMGRRPADRF